MQYIYDTIDIIKESPSVITLGKFDGFHLGHQKLIRCAKEHCRGQEQLVVFSFSTSPQRFLSGRSGEMLATESDRVALARRLQVDTLLEYPFTEEVRRMEARDFLENVLVRQLNMREIVVGPDCRFGYQGKGTAALLNAEAERLGYRVTILEKELYHGEVISSSRIKDCLRQGQIEQANDMLGYAYGVSGEVVHGKQLGRTLGIPTINQIAPADQLMPRAGVYRAAVYLGGERYEGIANVGRKPTIVGERPIGIETYIFDFNRDVYGEQARVNFLNFIRPEKKFDSLEELRMQILEDERKCRDFSK